MCRDYPNVVYRALRKIEATRIEVYEIFADGTDGICIWSFIDGNWRR